MEDNLNEKHCIINICLYFCIYIDKYKSNQEPPVIAKNIHNVF